MSRVTTERICPIASFERRLKYARMSERDQPNLTMEHYEVKWTIDCLRQVLALPMFEVSSPPFVLDSSRTEWCIEFEMRSSQDLAGFMLRRSDRRLDMPRVAVACKFGTSKTLGGGSVTWLNAVNKTKEVVIGHRCVVPFDASELEAFLQKLEDYEDRFTVTCEMYVTYEIPHYDDSQLTPDDYGLISFAFDFSNLINSLESADYSVTAASGNAIRVHKAILGARSRFLEDIVKKPNFKTQATFDDVSFDNLLAVLNYMYSGNLSKTLSREPSIGFYECARKFGLSRLETFLSPKVVQMRSTLDIRTVKFTWDIDNFSWRLKHSSADPAVVVSPEMCFDSERWVLVMKLYKRHDVLAIYARVYGETNSIHSTMNISLVNRKKKLVHTKTAERLGRLSNIFGYSDFLENFSVHDRDEGLVVGDTLKVKCQALFIVSSDFVERHSSSARGNEDDLDCYRSLSSDFLLLMSKVDLSDVTLGITSPQKFSCIVHKPVFFARSGYFRSRFLHHNRKDRRIEVPDVTQDVLRQMIHYAYIGRMDPPASVEELVSLYRASVRFVFPGLEILTLHHLASRLSIASFLQLYAESKALPSNYLEAKCEAFARENEKAIVVVMNCNWSQFGPEWQQELQNLVRKIASSKTG